MVSAKESSNKQSVEVADEDQLKATDSLIGESEDLFSSPRVVFCHTAEGDWVSMFDLKGEMVGDVSLQYREEIRALLDRYHLSGQKTVISIDPSLIEVTPRAVEGKKDSLIFNLSAEDKITIQCTSGKFVQAFANAKSLGLKPVMAESWIRSLPIYYEKKLGITDTVLTLIFGKRFVQLFVSRGVKPVAYHRFIAPEEGEEGYEKLVHDITQAVEFFQKKHQIKITHFAAYKLPPAWLSKLKGFLPYTIIGGESGLEAHAFSVGASLCLDSRVVPKWELPRERLQQFRQMVEQLTLKLQRFRGYGPLLWVGAAAALFVLSFILLQSRSIVADGVLGRWERKLASVKQVETRVNDLAKKQLQISSMRRVIAERSGGVKFSSAAAVIGKSIPSGIYLTKVAYSDGKLRVKGLSPSWPLIVSMMNQLSSNEQFAHVSPVEIKRLWTGAIEFEVAIVPR
ncbi:PilN domain-containing protein [Bdellovibrionota bacterium]